MRASLLGGLALARAIAVSAASLDPNFPSFQDNVLQGASGHASYGRAVAVDPVAGLTWTGGSAADATGTQGAVLTSIDLRGQNANVTALRPGSSGVPCPGGPFDYCAAGSSSTVTAVVVDAARRRVWAVGTLYASSGGSPLLFAASFNMDTGARLSYATESSSGTEARGAGLSAAGSVWIAGVAGGAAQLWTADVAAGLVAGDALADGGEADAVVEAPNGSVWAAGRDASTGEFALWNDDPNTGTITQYGWSNGLGGSGSVGRAVALLPGGVVAVAGSAAVGGRRAAALWRLSGDYWLQTLTSSGSFDEDSAGLALDDAGDAWLTGSSVLDASGDSALALWEMTSAGVALTASASYPGSQAPYSDAGLAAAYSQGAVWIAGRADQGRFTVWRYVLGTGNVNVTLAYAPGFGPVARGVGFFLSPNPSFNASPVQILAQAPADGSTSAEFVLSGLPAPATYYLAAVYDAAGLLGQTNGVPAADPLGLFADDASGTVTQVAPVFVPAGGAAAPGVVTLAVDFASPTISVAGLVAGSTIAASGFRLAGTASDNTSVVTVQVGLMDSTAGRWWDGNGFNSASVVSPLAPQVTGPVNAVSWRLGASDADRVRAALVPGRRYSATVQAADLVGNASSAVLPFVVISTAAGASSGRALARGPDGSFWVVADDGPATTPRLERRASDGSFLSASTLPGAAAQDAFGIVFTASGKVWVSGRTGSGLGAWKLDASGQTLLASPSVATNGAFGAPAADATENLWVPVAEPGGGGFQYSLYEFTSAGGAPSAPTASYQRGAAVDGGLAAAVDGSGNIWVAGVSSDPARGRLDLAVWKHSPAGVLQSGFPVFWPQSFRDLNSIRLSASLSGGKLWIAAQKSYDACAAAEAALVSFDTVSGAFGAKLWYDAAGAGAAAAGVSLDSAGNAWVSGDAAGAAVLWKYSASGSLVPSFPRSYAGTPFDERFVAVDAAGKPWVLQGDVPVPFAGGVTAAGAAGSPACALAGTAQVSGTLTYAGGFPAAGSVTLAVSTSAVIGGNSQPMLFSVPAAGGTTLPYSLTLPAPAVYYIFALDTASVQGLQPGVPVGAYGAYAPIVVASETVVGGIDVSLAPDLVAPVSAVTSLVDGATVAALVAVAGTAADNVGVDLILLGVHDLTFDVWWNAASAQWQASASPLIQDAQAAMSGTSAAAAWRANVSSGSFGGLAGYLAKGHQYRVLSQARDFSGNVEASASGPAVVWNGPNGTVAPSSPQSVVGAALGTSSISWTWSAVTGAASYRVSVGTATPVGSPTAASFVTTGLGPNASVSLCVAATNAYGTGPAACSPLAATLAVVPGVPSFSAVGASSFTAVWDPAGNPAGTNYAAALSTDGFATVSSVQTSNQAQAVFTGLASATAYWVRVRAVNGNGIATADSASATTRTAAVAPSAPQGLSGTALGVSSVAWSWSSSAGAADYPVTSTAGVSLGDPATPGFLVTALSTNTAAALCVAAHSAAGASAPVCASAFSAAAVPGAPSFTFAAPTALSLAWDAAGDPPGTVYQVELSLDGFASDVETVVPFSSAQTLASAYVPGLSPSTTYAARVRARNGDGVVTAPSLVSSTRTPASAPAAPSGLTAAFDAASKTVRLGWVAPTGGTPAASYQVFRGVALDTNTYAALAATTSTVYTDAPFTSATYYYQVAAANANGVLGPRSGAAVAAYDRTPPALVNDLRVSAVRPAQGQFDVSWTAVADDFSGVASYDVAVGTSSDAGAASRVSIPSAAPGTAMTYTVTVPPSQARFVTVAAVDGFGNEAARSNVALYDPVPPTLTGVGLTAGQTLTRPLSVALRATDNVAVSSFSLAVDGVFFASATGATASVFFDTRLIADGSHVVTAAAYDSVGNAASQDVPVTVSYAPPSPPVIASPADGFTTKVATITVTGTAEPGVGVELLANNLDVDSAAVVNGAWRLPSAALPQEGTVALTAVAFEARGFSSPSAAVNGLFSSRAPNAPELPTGESGPGGTAVLTWQAPSTGQTPAYYRVYRSTDDALLTPGGPAPDPHLIVAGRVAGLTYTDTPQADDLYFYGITASDPAGNESPLSDTVYSVTDRVPPTASVAISTPPPLTAGTYAVAFTLSKPLQAAPIFTFTPPGGQPQALDLASVNATLWQATVTVTPSMRPGAAFFAFQGTDLSGNVGTGVSSASWTLDTVGPAGTLALSRSSPLTAGALGVTLTLDKPALSTPTLSLLPQGASSALAVTLTAASPFDGTAWSGSLTVTGTTGDGTAVFSYAAVDLYGVPGSALGGTASFVLKTVAPGSPLAVRANSLPANQVMVTWSAPFGERPAGYFVYRDGVKLSTQVAPAADGSGAYLDTTTPGLHSYQVSSFDLAGNESAATDPTALARATPPSVPASAAASITGGQVLVTWLAGSTDTARFALYRSTYAAASTAGLQRLSPNAVSPFPDVPALDAVYHYYVTALDSVGNESAPSPDSSVTWTQGAPSVSLAGVTDGAYYAGPAAPSFVITDLTLDPSSVRATLDGAAFVSGSTVTAEGRHTLSVTAANLGGHSTTAQASFVIDVTPPQISFSVPSGAALRSTSPVSVQVTVTDLNPGTSSFSLTNLLLGTTVPYQTGAPISLNGRYRLDATAVDLAGNAASASLTFSLESAPQAPLNLAVVVNGDARLSWSSPEPDVVGYRLYRDGAHISASLYTGTFFEDSGYSSGAHVYEVSAVDAAGNEGPRARATVPAVALSLPALTLTRGFFDALQPTVTNAGTAALTAGPASVTLLDSGGNAVASATGTAVSVPPARNAPLPAVVAVPAVLTAGVQALVSVPVPTDAGASVTFTGGFPLSAADPAQPLLEIFPGTLVAGALSPVQVRLYNRGTAPMDVVTAQVLNSTFAPVNNVSVQLLTAQGTLFASGGLLQTGDGASAVTSGGRQYFFVTIPPGSSQLFDPVQVNVPAASAGTSLNVVASVSTPTYNLPLLAVPGTRSFAGAAAQSALQPLPYSATSSPNQPYYDQSSSVTISGQAVDPAGRAVPSAAVIVHVVSNGFDRRLAATTDANGNYSVPFYPAPTEAGVYTVSAAHPSVVSAAAQSTFSIVGYALQYSNYSATLAGNSSYRFTVSLVDTGATPVTGLTAATVLVSGSSLTATVDPATLPSSLAAGAQAQLAVTLSAGVTASSGTINLTLTESHGYSRTLPINITVVPAQVIPSVTPQQFSVGMLAGDTRLVSLVVQNKGFDTWRGVNVGGLAVPWAALQSPSALGDIAPGGNANVAVLFSPPSGLTNQTYSLAPLFQLFSSNVAPVPVTASVAVTSVRKGDVLVSAINADKPAANGQGVPVGGAKVTLVSLDVSGLTFVVTADANGLAAFSQVPSGNYAWHSEASGFNTVNGTALIEPGMTNQIRALMTTAVVSYKWTVTPTAIKDSYDVSLTLVFQTDVPAPVVVVDPPVTNLAMSGGQTAYTQLTVTNKGLISAFNVNLAPRNSDAAMHIKMGVTVIPELKPGQTVIVPVQVTLDHASCHGDAVDAGYAYQCSFGESVNGSAPAASFSAGDCGGGSGGGTGAPPQSGGGGGFAFNGSLLAIAAPGATVSPACIAPIQSYDTSGRDTGQTDPHNSSDGSSGNGGGSNGNDGRGGGSTGGASGAVEGMMCQQIDGVVTANGSDSETGIANLDMGGDGTNEDVTPTYNSQSPTDDGNAELGGGAGIGGNGSGNNGGSGGGIAAGGGARNGRGWYNQLNPNIKKDSNGNYVATDGRGNRRLFVPIGPLNQTSNGSGSQFAHPVHGYTKLSFPMNSGNSAAEAVSPPPTAFAPTMTLKDGTVVTYNAFQITGASSQTAVYLPVTRQDRNGNLTAYSRDNFGNLQQIVDPHGRTLTFTYGSNGLLTQITDHTGRHVNYTYDSNGNKTSETDPNGDATQYAYDSSHRITQVTYANGAHRYIVFNSTGQVASVSYDNGVNAKSFSYTSSQTIVTDALGRQTVYNFIQTSGLRRISSVVDPAGNTYGMTYDANMNLIASVDPLGRKTSFSYDANGNTVIITDPLNQTTITDYGVAAPSVNQNQSLPTGSNGGTSNLSLQPMTPLQAPNSEIGRFSFNQPLSVTDSKSNRSLLYYDAAGDLTSGIDALGNTTGLAYDKAGHVIAVKDPIGNVANAAYDSNGAITRIVDPLGRTLSIARDGLSRMTSLTDPLSNETDFTYNSAGQVTQVKDALNNVTAFTYATGRGGRLPKTVTDAKGHATTMNYDVLGRVTSVTNALGQSGAIAYDNLSRVQSVTNRNGQSFNFAYDNLDRLTQISANEGNINLSYDAVGHLLSASHYNGSSLGMNYDALDRVTQVVQTLPNGFSATLGYTYDANGNRTSMSTPWGNFRYAYDSLNRVTSITNPFNQTVTFQYDALGRRTKMAYPNGIVTTYAYDAAGQITQILAQKISNQTAVALNNYTYDADGNRIGMTDLVGAHSYGYDKLNRLTSANHPPASVLPAQSETFSLDSVGNRTADGMRTGYTYDAANRLISDSSFTYTYDANGNMASRTSRANGETTTYGYDSTNRLVLVSGPSGTIATYRYDAGGNRVEKNVAGTVTRYVYDGPNVLAILDANNNLLDLFTQGPGIDAPMIGRINSADYFYQADALGSVVALTDVNGAIIETAEYAAFGEAILKDANSATHNSSTAGNPFLYTGRELDSETHFYFNRARYYVPGSGRFLEEDPITHLNEYLYAANNPMAYSDPAGSCPTPPGGYSEFSVEPNWLELEREFSVQWPAGSSSPGGFNVFLSGGAAATVVVAGFDVGRGIAYSYPRNELTEFKYAGVGWGLSGGQYGLYGGGGATAGIIFGPPSNIGGPFENFMLAIPGTNLSVAIYTNSVGFQGIGMGYGPGVGFARTNTDTTTKQILPRGNQ